jgi:hypothetical protein
MPRTSAIVTDAAMIRMGFELEHTGGGFRAYVITRGSGLLLMVEATPSHTTPQVLLRESHVCAEYPSGVPVNLERMPKSAAEIRAVRDAFRDPIKGIRSRFPIARELAVGLLREAWDEMQPDERRK